MKKVVCFFINNVSHSGGTERVSSIIANQLSANNYSVLIISLFSEDDKSFFDLDPDIDIRTVFSKPIRGAFSFPLVFIRLKRLLAEYDVDVVVNVDSILAFYTVPVCSLSRTPIRNICWEHFNYHISLGKKIRNFSRTLAARYCDDVVTLTERDRSFWIENNAHIKNIVAINNPAPSTDETSVRHKVNTKVLLSVGRLTYQKGFDLLIKAFALVIKQRNDWALNIVGDGEDHQALSLLIDELKLADYIKLTPATSQIDDVYRSSSLYVMSSRFEGLPMVLLEAASFGLPIVSFDCDTGPSEVITQEFGWLCEPDNFAALAEGILQAFEQCDNPVTYERMSDFASSRTSAFSIETVTEKWIDLLER